MTHRIDPTAKTNCLTVLFLPSYSLPFLSFTVGVNTPHHPPQPAMGESVANSSRSFESVSGMLVCNCGSGSCEVVWQVHAIQGATQTSSKVHERVLSGMRTSERACSEAKDDRCNKEPAVECPSRVHGAAAACRAAPSYAWSCSSQWPSPSDEPPASWQNQRGTRTHPVWFSPSAGNTLP